MYNPETYFSKEVLERVLQQYDWPEKYELIKSPPSSVIVRFSRCTVVFVEGFDSNMRAFFLNKDTGRNDMQGCLQVYDAVRALELTHHLTEADITLLEGAKSLPVFPSLEKVEQGLRNLCIHLQVYLLPCIQGNFDWVSEYNRQYPES
ncbi:hypothetical protein HHL16_15525 [Pseudoflavitalea sp. G-6-1-2]|uniref:hypothetical protein n=1 Tax=Pseudoflavitalea sp. G-6-1-2 TaxID=2728841 RepID=UPI00146DAFF0|nr:hypothetical protein [Pseudoflavitalea sp. G-6-1-2]NML22294.1 hypothetical protein [Pseudoflavitalea sp. G-6-1-2]